MSWTPKYTIARRQVVIRHYIETRSIHKAADAAQVSPSFAHEVLTRAGVITSHPPVFRSSLITKAIRLYQSGLSCRKVALELAKIADPAPSQQWVHMRVREAGVGRSHVRANEIQETKRRGKDYDAIRKVARKLAADKLWSVKRIADHLNVSKKMVARALPPALRCNRSQAMEKRKWQAYAPDVEERRARRDTVIEMRRIGKTYTQIQAATGLSRSTIYRYAPQRRFLAPAWQSCQF